LAFSYWFNKPWFLTEGRLATVLIIPSSWGSQLGGYLPALGIVIIMAWVGSLDKYIHLLLHNHIFHYLFALNELNQAIQCNFRILAIAKDTMSADDPQV
jgi:hypothetical protein